MTDPEGTGKITMLQAMANAKRQADLSDNFECFLKTAALVMTSQDLREAAGRSEATGQPSKVTDVLKAAVAGGTLSGVGLTGFGPLVGSFMSSLANVGAFETVAGSAMKLPSATGRIVFGSSFTVGAVGEGAAKPVRPIVLNAADVTPVKAAVTVVLSKELIDGLTAAGLNLLAKELRVSVAKASDAALFTALAGNEADAQQPDSFQGVIDDLEELARLVNMGAGSKPYFIVTPEVAKALAFQAIVAGVDSLTWNGGSIAGIPVLVSDSQSADRITLVDASSLAIWMTEIALRSSEQATVQMDTAPGQESTTPTAANQVSMWQTDSRALICERQIAIKPIRGASYAHLTGVLLAGSDSPAGA